MTRRRLVELGLLLPWAGTFLLTPPAVIIVQTWARAAGIPLFTIYLFACWLALIVIGGVLTAKLARLEEPPAATRAGDERG